jgi:hypothetical protein
MRHPVEIVPPVPVAPPVSGAPPVLPNVPPVFERSPPAPTPADPPTNPPNPVPPKLPPAFGVPPTPETKPPPPVTDEQTHTADLPSGWHIACDGFPSAQVQGKLVPGTHVPDVVAPVPVTVFPLLFEEEPLLPHATRTVAASNAGK